MNILELDSYNLGDAVKFHDHLNPRLWGKDEHLLPEVRSRLMEIAEDFCMFLGVDNIGLKDITVSGSNAAFNYTPHSDVDLHVIVDLPEADNNEVYRELFDAKKYQYNTQHHIKIGGADVELYVQNANEPHHSQGIYSVLNNDWVEVPRRVKADIDDVSTRSKYEDIKARIDDAVKSGSYATMQAVAQKIKEMRQSGLDQHGEFGPENLAFKMLRSQGKIKELFDARNAAKDQELSLKERNRIKQPVVYGFKTEDAGLTWDGVDPTTCMFANEDAGETWDGVNPTTTMFANEGSDKMSDEDVLKDFIEFCVAELQIEQMPDVKLRRDPQWPVMNKTFGRYSDDLHRLEVAFGRRHIMDVLRTVAHELTHKHQHERENVPGNAGETGSEYENEANARAGILMRDYGRSHPELFAASNELDEGWKQKAAAAAVAGSMALGAGGAGAQTVGRDMGRAMSNMPGLSTISDIGRTYNTFKNVNWPAMLQGEAQNELFNYAQALSGNSQGRNLSNLYAIQKRMFNDPEWQAKNPDLYRQYQQTQSLPPIQAPEPKDPKQHYYNPPQPMQPDAVRTYESDVLDKPTMTVAQLAAKHQVDKQEIIKQLAMGINVEHEHTKDRQLAKEIALDHLAELPDYYTRLKRAETTNESASGYIPTKKQANDPRFIMALSPDIKPGQLGKEANKLGLQTDRQGHPPVMNGSGQGVKTKYPAYGSRQDVGENFADGKGPGRPGDSQRHGIPKNATMAELEKASHAGGRKGQLARWQLNMRRGHKK